MIHCFEQGGISLVLDVASGALHALDPVAYRICTMLQPPPSKAMPR